MRGGAFAVWGAVALLACLVRAAAAAPGTPSVTSLSPVRGGVGTVVTVSGRNLGTATAVTFAGTSASFAVVSATRLTATVPTGAATGHVAVTTPAGTATSKASFTVVPAPAVSGFTPTGGTPGTRVTISGAEFTGASLVTLGGVKASFSIRSATTITATVPANAVTGTVAVKTVGGTGTSGGTFTVVPLPPKITSFSPVKAGAGMTITVAGSHLGVATAVTVGGASAAFTVLSDAKLSVTIPSASGAISVTTPGGTATSRGSFTLLPTPQIDSLAPTSAVAGTRVTITGSSLTGATLVAFGGTKATFTRKNDTTIVATVPAKAASGAVTVTTPGGVATSGDGFTVIPPAPRINSFAPVRGGVGALVTITGSNLTGATAVTFAGTAGDDVTVVSATKVTAEVPDGAGTGTLSVTTAGGTATSHAQFTVLPGPEVDSFAPTSGPAGTPVTITGVRFTGATAVTFGGTRATFHVDSDTQISATVPNGAATGRVAVTTPVGPGTSDANFVVGIRPGDQRWVTEYDSEYHLQDTPTDVAVSPDGSAVFVTGESESPDANLAYVTVKYDADTGNQLWVEEQAVVGAMPGVRDWIFPKLAVSPDGSRVFVFGSTYTGDATGNDFMAVAYDAGDGSQLWEKTYDGGVGGPDRILAGGITPDGSTLLLSGSTLDYATPGYAPSLTTITLAASDGALKWMDGYAVPGDGVSWASIAVTADGTRAYVYGAFAADTGTAAAAVVAYDLGDGHQAWAATQPWAVVGGVALSPDGSTVYASGTSLVAYAAVGGTQLWSAPLPNGSAWNLVVAQDGSAVYASGGGLYAFRPSDGSSLWSVNGVDGFAAVGGSTIFVAGWSNTGGSATAAYGPDGTQRWIQTGTSTASFSRIAATADGSAVYPIGWSNANNGDFLTYGYAN